MVVQLATDVLFDSGSARLSPQASTPRLRASMSVTGSAPWS